MVRTVHDERQISFLTDLLATLSDCPTDDPEVLEDCLREQLDRRIRITDGPEWVPNAGTWTDDEVLALMEGILHDSLYQLVDSRAGSAGRSEAMSWLMETDAVDEDGNPWPFSFEGIAKCLGYDAEEVREQILNEGRRLGVLRTSL